MPLATANRAVPLIFGLICGALLAGVPMGYRLNAANQRIAELQDQQAALRTEANQRISQLAKRDLPVEIKYRRAFFWGGSVLIVQNTSGQDLPITAQFSRAGAPSMTRELVVPVNGAVTVGAAQGWAFVPGDSIKLQNPKFRDWYNPSINW